LAASLRLGETFDFTAETSKGAINFHEWIGDFAGLRYFRIRADYTPVCTTELGAVARIKKVNSISAIPK